MGRSALGARAWDIGRYCPSRGQTRARLAERYRSGSPAKAERYEALRPYLDGEGPPYREAAARLGLSETAVKVAVHRLRGHFREALRAEVADTLADAKDVDDEIRDLLEAIRT